MSLVANGIPVASMRWLAGWSGVWSAELELASDVLPFGRVAIVSTEGIALSATVDDNRSGTFGERRSVGVLGGAGGWRKKVRSQHYQSDIGLPLSSVVTTTAAEVGEVAIVLAPQVLSTDFIRVEDRAAQIFTDLEVDWWVGLDGVTRVGKRLPVVQPISLLILEWNPLLGTASFTAEVLVEPGTIVIDIRFGQRVVREVDATVSNGSVTGTLWLVEDVPDGGTISELVSGLAAIARAAVRPEYLRLYEYRVIEMAGDRVELQIADPLSIIPDVLPASVWAGASGYRAKLLPSSRVLVGFYGKDRKPYVAAYEPPDDDGWRPLELELDALTSVTIGGEALAVILGGAGALPIARAPAVITFAQAVQIALTAAAAAANATGAAPVIGTSLGALLTTLAGAVQSAVGALTSNCPSTKVTSS